MQATTDMEGNEMKNVLNQDDMFNEKTAEVTKKKFKMPHIYVLLIIFIILAYIATLVIPQGSFQRNVTESGASVVVPGTFQFVDGEFLSPMDILFAIPNGMVQAGAIIFGGLMIGALFSMLERIGLIDVGLRLIMKGLRGNSTLLIIVMMIIMAGFTSITAAGELMLIYVPVMLPVMLKLGYDRMTAVGLVLVAVTAGFSTAITAPATVGVAQTIMELPLYSGMGFRLIVFAIILITGIIYVLSQAHKVKKNPASSMLYNDGHDIAFIDEDKKAIKPTSRHYIGLLFLVLGIGVMLYGMMNQGWYFIQIGGWYAFLAIVLGFIGGLKPDEIADEFHKGFKMVLMAGIIIGLSRSIAIVLENGQIIDTIVYYASDVLSALPTALAPIGMFIFQGLFNFLVGSGSGQAMITMPIMSGLSDLLGVSRQTAVLAFQFGDGFTNMLYPTGIVVAVLALAHVPYTKWMRFFLPLAALWMVICGVALVIAQMIGL